MSRPRILLAAALLAGGSADAQTAVPGRDLLSYPIGLVAEAPALGQQAAAGFWNPASALLQRGERGRVGVGTLTAAVDVGVSAQLASGFSRIGETTLGASVVRASVRELIRTESDPQSIGQEIPYHTTVLSLHAGRMLFRRVAVGAALRHRAGRLDEVQRSATSLDLGVLASGLPFLDARLAVSSFLGGPLAIGEDRAGLTAAADLRVMGTDTLRTARVGWSLLATEGLSREQYLFGESRWQRLIVRGGAVHTAAYGESNWRLRLGVSLRHGGYAVGIAREESTGNLSPTYQFSLSSVLR